jgi:hypothetical protein
MGVLVVTELSTLDGVAQLPGDPDEGRGGGFTHGAWQAPLLDPGARRVMFEQAKRIDAVAPRAEDR